ncbi:hypothetical protein FN846DRAFT_970209 [Sphaerosporella brunnea]|uniref:CFEM domain-containing protein n=1 Tax=Sphaerosporella brunnea TaxID=1250544 RepID=A0A5J5EJC1_9PEZI|nr:hypothetical protein FN846DRAFT_970209 [Sphaerosporella brunnea]
MLPQFLLLTLAAVAATSPAPAPTTAWPPCASSCVAAVIPDSGCTQADGRPCLCQQSIINEAALCISNDCDAATYSMILDQTSAQCNGMGPV